MEESNDSEDELFDSNKSGKIVVGDTAYSAASLPDVKFTIIEVQQK